MTAIEGGTAGFAFASGMAAEDTIIRSVCKPGDHIIIPEDLYAGTFRLLDKVLSSWGISFTAVPLDDPARVQEAIVPATTRLIWCETPTNPLLAIADIAALAEVAKMSGVKLVVDNTLASPFLQQPLALGADIVVHSTTKYLGGHSDALGGAVVVRDEALAKTLLFHQNAMGAVASPFDAWLTLRGIKTLAVRMERICATAMKMASFLERHPAVTEVFYPGLERHPGNEVARKQMSAFGGVISFTVKGEEDGALHVCNTTRLFTLAESLGAVESLISHPLRMTHASAARSVVAPPPDLVRLSIGLESADDLIADIRHALDSSG